MSTLNDDFVAYWRDMYDAQVERTVAAERKYAALVSDIEATERPKPPMLIASGGWCAPTAELFALPDIRVRRGGVKFKLNRGKKSKKGKK